MNPGSLNTVSLQNLPWGPSVRGVLSSALRAVDPYEAVRRALKVDGHILTAGARPYDLGAYRRVVAVGAGKAAYPMALALEEALGPRLDAGLLVTKDGHVPPINALRRLRIVPAGHPIPDERGAAVAVEIATLLHGLDEHDLVFCLISGGGSALLASPVEGISLDDLQRLTNLLLKSGADIQQINCLRKHLEMLKGGGLARLAAPASLVSLVLSDVVGDPLDAIASGPTVPDPTTFADAWAVLSTAGLVSEAPVGVVRRLQRGLRGEVEDTLKPGDPIFARVNDVIVASNYQAASAASTAAREAGFSTLLLTTSLQGEARAAGELLAAVARQIHTTGEPLHRPACLIVGGETTVTVRGEGLGGRNQELALGAVQGLAGLPSTALVALATDGGDGPTNAAGAVVTGETLGRARALSLDPVDFLRRNDAYHFFEPLGDLLVPGPTRTNVNDLAFVFMF